MFEELLTQCLLSQADTTRKLANSKLEVETKSSFGQYLTPTPIASFMASLFPVPSKKNIRLLDPGAGVGSLTLAFVDRLNRKLKNYHIEVDAYEIDSLIRTYLEQNLKLCEKKAEINSNSLVSHIWEEDFIIKASDKLSSSDSLWPEVIDKYTHCIMNPPYKKISSSSRHRASLRKVGIETVNLYSAFLALALLLLENNGHLVAIIPRSFCNGLYYRPFREFLLNHAALKRIHLFESRNKAFKDDKVLQENIILALEKGGRQKDVAISTSTDDTLSDITISRHPFNQIVKTNDKELYIHIPLSSSSNHSDFDDIFCYSLNQIGLHVSTGPVVDFRMKDQLRKMPEKGAVPLLYPCHFKGSDILWPMETGKKPNAIMFNQVTQKWLYPNGFYTVIRRFSSKEEKRRVVASVVDPAAFGKVNKLGLENHLNIFHNNKKPLTEEIARGLAVYLNSTFVDNNFRSFSGHTQVNATDLKCLKYPSRTILAELGRWAMNRHLLSQNMIDKQIERISR